MLVVTSKLTMALETESSLELRAFVKNRLSSLFLREET